MLTPHFRLEGERLYLRPITIDDVNETYVEWLNDPEVNQFLENRFEVHTLASARAYLQKISQNSTNVFLVMVRKDTEALGQGASSSRQVREETRKCEK